MPPKAIIEKYTDAQGCPRWRMKGMNGEIVAPSEAYSSKAKRNKTVKFLESLALPGTFKVVEIS